MKSINLMGCCGISCVLCPRFQSKAKSQCLGCGPDGHCSYCSIFRCCQMKHSYETCADCDEFPCEKFRKWFDGDSFVTHQKCLPNINDIKKVGIKKFLKEQKERKIILEIALEKYNSGRCTSLFCLAAAKISIESLKKAIKQADNNKYDGVQFKELIEELANKEGISLKLRK